MKYDLVRKEDLGRMKKTEYFGFRGIGYDHKNEVIRLEDLEYALSSFEKEINEVRKRIRQLQESAFENR